jgi:5'-methylthioadenosine phosphorylase
MNAANIGIIGGSGLYQIEGLTSPSRHVIKTPFGKPSDVIFGGKITGRQVYFLPRHGRGHTILPHELNHRANIHALRSLNVRWIICVTAVGSLQKHYKPRDIVLPSQFFDRTSSSAGHTFFGGGIAAHVGFADPVSANLRNLLAAAGEQLNHRIHNGGTYVNMDGPAFSTRAESQLNRKLGFDVIGMTNLGEAKLAREAEIALATLAMVTDYDCWKVDEKAVTAHAVVEHLHANAKAAKEIIAEVIPSIPLLPDWPEHSALDHALITAPALWPPKTFKKLEVILKRFRPAKSKSAGNAGKKGKKAPAKNPKA